MHLGFVIWVFQPFETFPNFQPNPTPNFLHHLPTPTHNPNFRCVVDFSGSSSSNFTFSLRSRVSKRIYPIVNLAVLIHPLWRHDSWDWYVPYQRRGKSHGAMSSRWVKCWMMEMCFFWGWKKIIGKWCRVGVVQIQWGWVFDGKWWGCEVVISVIRMSSLTLSQYFALVQWFWEWTFGIAWGVLFESVKGLRPSENIYSILSKS